jgi:hypothetical protein
MTDLTSDIAPAGCHGLAAPGAPGLWMAEAFIPKLARIDLHLAELPKPELHRDASGFWPSWLRCRLAAPRAEAQAP